MESSSLQNGKWKRKIYKEEYGLVPTSPNTPPSSQHRVARAPKCSRYVSLRKTEEKGPLDTSTKNGAWRKPLTARR